MKSGHFLDLLVFLQVISGQQLPKLNKDKQNSIVDPLVRVEIYGVHADNASKQTQHMNNNGERAHTQINSSLFEARVSQNSIRMTHKKLSFPAGFNPMWNESFQFTINVPELAMVRFVVEDYDSTSQNDLIGQYCLQLNSIQNGKSPENVRN